MNICKQCGKEITTAGRILFCSAECQVIFYKKEKKSNFQYVKKEKIKKICKCCGKDFFSGNIKQIFCEEKCAIKFHSLKRSIGNKIKRCKYCGKEFEANHFNAKYCSPVCYQNNAHSRVYYTKYKVNNPYIIKKCLYCEKEFTTNMPAKIFCCKQCKDLHRYKNKPKKIKTLNGSSKNGHNIIKICEVCGKEFVTKISNQTICSVQCRRDKKNISRKKVKEIKNCIYCGKEFIANRCDQIYCNKKCWYMNEKNNLEISNIKI